MSSLLTFLSVELNNSGTLYFYREGVFYKAYEQSAYLFVKYVKPFQVKKRFVKSVKQEVASERWRADIPLMQVRMFPIEAKTPLDCMLFLSEIKKQLE